MTYLGRAAAWITFVVVLLAAIGGWGHYYARWNADRTVPAEITAALAARPAVPSPGTSLAPVVAEPQKTPAARGTPAPVPARPARGGTESARSAARGRAGSPRFIRTGMVSPPVLIHEVKPVYPFKANIIGFVNLAVTIGCDGSVRQARVVSGNPIFFRSRSGGTVALHPCDNERRSSGGDHDSPARI